MWQNISISSLAMVVLSIWAKQYAKDRCYPTFYGECTVNGVLEEFFGTSIKAHQFYATITSIICSIATLVALFFYRLYHKEITRPKCTSTIINNHLNTNIEDKKEFWDKFKTQNNSEAIVALAASPQNNKETLKTYDPSMKKSDYLNYLHWYWKINNINDNDDNAYKKQESDITKDDEQMPNVNINASPNFYNNQSNFRSNRFKKRSQSQPRQQQNQQPTQQQYLQQQQYPQQQQSFQNNNRNGILKN